MLALILVLLFVCLVCGSLPLLASAYMSENPNILIWLVNVLAFAGIAIIAILRFQLKLSYGNPAHDLLPKGKVILCQSAENDLSL